GQRAECPVVRGNGAAGHPVHRDLVARAGHEDPAQDPAGVAARQGLLIGGAMAGSIQIGVVGCGYWGPNHIRVFSSLGRLGARMTAAADQSEERRRHVAELYPRLRVETQAETVLKDPDPNAVVIATPVHPHYPFARMAIEAGQHVLAETPCATARDQAQELIALPRERRLPHTPSHPVE